MSGSPDSLSFGAVAPLAHSPARESIVVPATKIPDVGQHEFVVVDYVKLVVRVSPEIHPIQGARTTSH